MVRLPGLTVHVLDTTRGVPAEGMAVTLFRLDGNARAVLGVWMTNADGRSERPMLDAATMRPGIYEVVFDVATWRRERGETEPGFYDRVPVRFVATDPAGHYHIPLLLAPYGYSTYRGG